MFEQELTELQRSTNGVCVSIIVPTHHLAEERAGDRVRVKNAVHIAELALARRYGEQNVKKLVQKIKDAAHEIDFVHETNGLGVYVSGNFSKVVRFPFPVEEKLIINNRFHIRELIYGNKSFIDYYVILLSRKGTRLFKNELLGLAEIRNSNFPLEFSDDYEYPKAHLATPVSFSLKGEGDKSIIDETRLKDFLRTVDDAAAQHLSNSSKLILAGIQQHLSYFQEVRRHQNEIIGMLEGNFDRYSISDIAKLASKASKDYIRNKSEELIHRLKELRGRRKVVSGFRQVMEAAAAGNADILIVEKDFKGEIPSVQTGEGGKVTVRDSNDPVTDLIEQVITKKGDVVFVDNGLLEEYERVALILRYAV